MMMMIIIVHVPCIMILTSNTERDDRDDDEDDYEDKDWRLRSPGWIQALVCWAIMMLCNR